MLWRVAGAFWVGAASVAAFSGTGPSLRGPRRGDSSRSRLLMSSTPHLELKGVKCGLEDGKEILKGVDLQIKRGEIHAIMGPNGSGKSTLSKVISGHPEYLLTGGQILLNGEDVNEMEIEERSHKGLFLAFQYPVEIPGVRNEDFLRAAVNSKRKALNETELDPLEFSIEMYNALQNLQLDESFMERGVNEGFSGGEKKRNEVLQMVMLNPDLVILDETDSGLDVDSLKTAVNAVNNFKTEDKSILIITHYKKVLDLIKPDHVHILKDGRIFKSGGPELAEEVELSGFEMA
uniref:ABC transporter domain-containing protein n=1 Tax=Chromera velia CCMP2878 TaxID=1169474 RepID=A0A0G4I166_9ALVE|eukprot:Cvel_14.t1-p1 / transcript=Cvel_14.t1 / gene=Cvel_14 / organism=Chromera_velia_CCMP2878 / gene_product=Probable ATP-dependent transporter ycf16, putative / transcript_product=Probable ATP-dependent transporter ycf16, putative / location=Cvel_scaffold5:89713-90582(+) / protein_length=290 / sequence_SO=supercontig / SO=protein_coding / is_pseudo=false